jgi:hypothetical protein
MGKIMGSAPGGAGGMGKIMGRMGKIIGRMGTKTKVLFGTSSAWAAQSRGCDL